jgi:hypothetical protein
VGLRDSQLLNVVGRDGEILSEGTEGKFRGTEVAFDSCGSGELVEDIMLLVKRRSSMLLRAGADDTCP